MDLDYPKEWNDLPKRDRKKKIKELKRKKANQKAASKKFLYVGALIVVIAVIVIGYRLATKKNPEDIAFEQEVSQVSLEGKVEDFEVEAANHVGLGEDVTYGTNPPTSGSHWPTPANWGFNNKELSDEQLVHNLEHGGIWITFKGLDEASIDKLKRIARSNSNSVIVSKREVNDSSITVVSWGRMMNLEEVDEALIQKYIDTFINQSPERFAS